MKRVVLVTGGTRGIGFATAKKFAENGYAVAINGYSEANGEFAEKTLVDLGYDVMFFKADVTKEDEVNELVKLVAEKFGRIDVLVNNAGGLGGRQRFENMETSFWHSVLDLNLNSVFYVSRAVVPFMKEKGGSIINLTSIAAYHGGGPGASAYAVSKAGVLALTRGMSKELIDSGIRVNAVSPGTVDTDFHAETNKELMKTWLNHIPAKRFGVAEDVANAVFFLSSEESSYIVGEVLQINGGQDFR